MTDELNQRPCCYILTIFDPVETCMALMHFFTKRSVTITNLQYQVVEPNKAILIVYVHISRDRLNYITSLLKQNALIGSVELLEGREIK
ncbi:MAG: hypothetical protein QM764_22165 [Chitinophagaceae bacterium]